MYHISSGNPKELAAIASLLRAGCFSLIGCSIGWLLSL